MCALTPGTDSGAQGFNGLTNEKQMNIAVAGCLQNALLALGYESYRTQNRETTNYPHTWRAQIANGERPNDDSLKTSCRIFIGIHMNGWAKPDVLGTETLYATDKYYAKTVLAFAYDLFLAIKTQQALLTYTPVAFFGCSKNRGVKVRNGLTVLTRTRAPAAIVECCFISNPCQCGHIITPGDQDLVASGIAVGVGNFFMGDLRTSLPHSAGKRIASLAAGAARSEAGSLHEDFEGSTFPPQGWTTQTAGLGAPYCWYRTTDSLYVGNGSASARVGGESAGAVDEWLISPSVSLKSADRGIRFLWSGSHQWSNQVDASLNLRAVGTSTWTQLWSLASDEPSANPFIYRERSVNISAWKGANVQFGFHVAGTNGADFAIDDVITGDFDPTGAAPNDMCADATTLGSAFSVQGVTCYATNDLNPYTSSPSSCVDEDLDGPDVFYEIGGGPGDSLHATVTAQWGAFLYLTDGCGNPTCLAGTRTENGADTAWAINYRLPHQGPFYLVVDGVDGSCGPFQIDGQIIHVATGVVGSGTVPPLRLVVRPNPTAGPVGFFGSLPTSESGTPIIEIYDVAGKRVMRAEGSPRLLEFSFVWNGRNEGGERVAPGVYFARLQFGRQVAVQKFVILR
jgi:N-acetylmuramoyl-L-alanine amidase